MYSVREYWASLLGSYNIGRTIKTKLLNLKREVEITIKRKETSSYPCSLTIELYMHVTIMNQPIANC